MLNAPIATYDKQIKWDFVFISNIYIETPCTEHTLQNNAFTVAFHHKAWINYTTGSK